MIWLGRPQAESTWEQAQSLPAALVKEFEKGIHCELHSEVLTSEGQTLHTVSSVQRRDEAPPPPVKRPCITEYDTSSSGWV